MPNITERQARIFGKGRGQQAPLRPLQREGSRGRADQGGEDRMKKTALVAGLSFGMILCHVVFHAMGMYP